MTTLPYIVLAAVALWFVGATVAYQIRLRRRRGPSRDDFIAAFSSGGEPLERIAGTVYDYYSSLAVGRRYAVSPDDSYEDLLRAGPEEIRDDADDLLRQMHLEMPAQLAFDDGPTPIATIRDMVHWLNWARTHQSGDLPL